MNCAVFEIRLADYLDGLLSMADRAALESHAASCAACGEMLQDAREGLALLGKAGEVVTPPDLLTRIAYQAPVGRLRDPWEDDSFFSRLFRPIAHLFLQPRIAMSMAMTILSFAMLERCTGIHVQHIQAAELNPIRIWGGVEDKAVRAKDRAVKYYENLRWVYEIEQQMSAFQRQAEADAQKTTNAQGSAKGQENLKDGKK